LPLGKRFSAIDGEDLTGLLVMELKKPTREIILAKEKSQILGDYDRPGNNALNSTWYVMTEIPGLKYRCWEFVWLWNWNMA